MSKKTSIYHLMILDRSGSMQSVQKETVGGFNENLKSIRESQEKHEDKQNHYVCFVTFGTTVDDPLLWKKHISDVKNLVEDDYNPDGYTALHDAVGISLSRLKEELKDEFYNREANVIVTIFTDGQENNSKRFNGHKVASMIKDLQSTKSWLITFAGCDESALEQAEAYNIRSANTMLYAAGAAGTTKAYNTMSRSRCMVADQLADKDVDGAIESLDSFDFYAKEDK